MCSGSMMVSEKTRVGVRGPDFGFTDPFSLFSEVHAIETSAKENLSRKHSLLKESLSDCHATFESKLVWNCLVDLASQNEVSDVSAESSWDFWQ